MGSLVFAGARAIFRVNGVKIAFASGCSGSEEIQYEPVEVLDNLEVQEYVPVGYRVSFSCEIFRTIKGSPGAKLPRDGTYGSVKQMGIMPQVGKDVTTLLTAGVLTCSIEDRSTGEVIMQLEEAKASNNNWSVTPRGVVGQNLSFVAIRQKDESEI